MPFRDLRDQIYSRLISILNSEQTSSRLQEDAALCRARKSGEGGWRRRNEPGPELFVDTAIYTHIKGRRGFWWGSQRAGFARIRLPGLGAEVALSGAWCLDLSPRGCAALWRSARSAPDHQRLSTARLFESQKDSRKDRGFPLDIDISFVFRR